MNDRVAEIAALIKMELDVYYWQDVEVIFIELIDHSIFKATIQTEYGEMGYSYAMSNWAIQNDIPELQVNYITYQMRRVFDARLKERANDIS